MHRRAPLAAGLDTASVVLFVAIGRRNHDEDPGVAGLLSTAWPFLVALLVGWLTWRAWRNPADVRTGAQVWFVTLIGGMALRNLSGQGTAWSFVIVAALFLAATMIGWRLVLTLVDRRRAPRATPNTVS